MKKISFIFLLPSLILFNSTMAFAQMKRKRANIPHVVHEAFWSPTLITQATTHQLNGGTLNVTILHGFGIATEKPIQNFFGFDQVQDVRLGFDVGLTDWWSMGIGRSSLLNIVDLRTKFALLRQSLSGSGPLSISLRANIADITQENLRPLKDDISTLVSVIFSRKFNEILSLQIIPMYAHFSNFILDGGNNYFALGLGTTLHLNEQLGLMAEYYPVIGRRPNSTVNSFSLGLNVKTGGHVFQLFFASTQWFVPQYIIARNENDFFMGDFRFGFNINRIFGL